MNEESSNIDKLRQPITITDMLALYLNLKRIENPTETIKQALDLLENHILGFIKTIRK